MKIVLCLVTLCALSGVAQAQGVTSSRAPVFTAQQLAFQVARLQQNTVSAQREPMFTREKLTRPNVLVGLGLMATGAILAATASETATITTLNPVTGQPFTSTITATNNGRRWVGIGMLGSGGMLTYLGLSK